MGGPAWRRSTGIPTAAGVPPGSFSGCGRRGPWGTRGQWTRDTSVQALSCPLMTVLTFPIRCHPFRSTWSVTQLYTC